MSMVVSSGYSRSEVFGAILFKSLIVKGGGGKGALRNTSINVSPD